MATQHSNGIHNRFKQISTDERAEIREKFDEVSVAGVVLWTKVCVGVVQLFLLDSRRFQFFWGKILIAFLCLFVMGYNFK